MPICEVCGNPIEAGQKYRKIGHKYYHSECIAKEKSPETLKRIIEAEEKEIELEEILAAGEAIWNYIVSREGLTKIYDDIWTNYDNWEYHSEPTISLVFEETYKKLNEEDISNIKKAIYCWYHDSQSDMWGRPLKWIEDTIHVNPVLGHTFITFDIDLNLANEYEALKALAERLSGYGLNGLLLDLDIDTYKDLYLEAYYQTTKKPF